MRLWQFSAVKCLFSAPFSLSPLLLIILSACAHQKPAPVEKTAAVPVETPRSSEIPARREFPINSAINPCENFYDYVCSDVIKSFQLREDRSSHTFAFSDSSERLLLKKQDFFKNLALRETKSKRETGLKNYYLSCMDEKDGARDEKSEVKRLTGVFASLENREAMLTWLQKSHLTAEADPIDWGPITNLEQSTRSDLYVTTGFMTLPEKTYYKNQDVLNDFRIMATQFYTLIGLPDPAAKADVLIQFESKLAEAFPAPADFRKLINDRRFISHEQLLKEFPNLRLQPLLAKLPPKIVIRNWVPENLKILNEFFGKADLDVIRTVMLYHSLSPLLDDAYPDYYKTKFEFNRKHFGGPNVRPARDERCTSEMMGAFTKEIDSILLPELFPNLSREKVVKLAEQIRGTLLSSLEKNSWLSKVAKKEAVLKMKKARLFLVSPTNEKEWDFLPEGTYLPAEPLANSRMVSKVYKIKRLKRLNEPQDTSRWSMGPLTVNAYYDPAFNKFVLPAGILQYPFYDADRSNEMNLGSVGAVMGHELGHGVDDQGSRFDADGKQREWMTPQDLAEFSSRTKQLVSQFDKAGQNGQLTLGENIGDLVGLTAALDAASLDPSFQKTPERVRGFFESYARNWCQVARPKHIEKLLKTDPHSLGINRVNEQMKQQPVFRSAFQCKDTDPMVLPRNDLVHIW